MKGIFLAIYIIVASTIGLVLGVLAFIITVALLVAFSPIVLAIYILAGAVGVAALLGILKNGKLEAPRDRKAS